MIVLTNPFGKTVDEFQQLNNVDLHNCQNASWFQEVIENFQDGILILSETGDLIYTNSYANHIIRQLNEGTSNMNVLPPPIWKLCEFLLERNLSRDKVIILSDEIVVDKSNIFRIRVRWLDLKQFERPYLLMVIENRCESLNGPAFAEAIKYNLTDREKEVWCLYRAKYSYKEIASNLCISINTVKKHIKNIRLKQQVFLIKK